MNRSPFRIMMLALATATAAGCAMNESRDDETASVSRTESTTVVRRESTHVDRSRTVAPARDALVGVPACDDFLSSYRACHAVIGAYAPDVLERRYDELRRTLVSQASDPEVSASLEARCNGLIAQRDEALAGRACLTTRDDSVADGDDDEDLFDDGD
jgi:hypothetical protein